VNFQLFIIVPTLNSFTLLPRLLSSLQDQSWPNWQLLFIDGPSSPSHRRWLEECCEIESRCSWIKQSLAHPGIFGAMNQGFAAARPTDWLLFWGSDDWAASSTVFADVMSVLSQSVTDLELPDLLICTGRYSSLSSGSLGRFTKFRQFHNYRTSLLLGSSPPHQSTVFGPNARVRLASYSEGFLLSADLDYFLQLSRFNDLRVQVLNLELVHMSSGGISGKQTSLRLQEVCRAYQRTFGWLWWFPFFARYVRRIFSLLEIRR